MLLGPKNKKNKYLYTDMKRTLILASAALCALLAVSCGNRKVGRGDAAAAEQDMTQTIIIDTAEHEVMPDTAVPECTDTVEVAEVEYAQREKGRILGQWPAIRMSCDSATFDSRGGSVTVKCENYSSWWLNGIQIYGTETFHHADPGEKYEYLTASAPGISAEIKNSSEAVITVAPSSEGGVWLVHLEAGDAFTTFKVIQK